MKRIFSLSIIMLVSLLACGQVQQIVGDWKTVDDKTGKNYSIVRIYKGTDGLYYGKIQKMLIPGTEDLTCTECVGPDAGAKIEGLVIIRGMHEEEGELRGGRLLDPESGKFYYGKLYIKNGKLVLRGSLDRRGLLGRNQTWIK